MAIVINELLTYAKHYINCSAIDNVKRMIQNFYTDDEILTAKKSLWDITTLLGKYPERKSSDTRSASVAHVNDIFDALMKLDAADAMPNVAACNLDRVPDRQPEEMNLLLLVQRVAALERIRDQHSDTLSTLSIDILSLQEPNKSYASALNANERRDEMAELNVAANDDARLTTSRPQQGNETTNKPGTSSIPRSQYPADDTINMPGNSGGSRDHHPYVNNKKTEWNKSEKRSSIGGRSGAGNVKALQRDRGNPWREGQVRHGSSIRRGSGGRQQNGNPRPEADEDGFMMVRSRKSRRVGVEGAAVASGSGLEGAPPPVHYVWVNRVQRGDEKMLKKHMEDNDVQVKSVAKISHNEAKFKSFKVGVLKSDVQKVMSQSFWPVGVRCQPWKMKRVQNNDIETENHGINETSINVYNVEDTSDVVNNTMSNDIISVTSS